MFDSFEELCEKLAHELTKDLTPDWSEVIAIKKIQVTFDQGRFEKRRDRGSPAWESEDGSVLVTAFTAGIQ